MASMRIMLDKGGLYAQLRLAAGPVRSLKVCLFFGGSITGINLQFEAKSMPF